MSSGGIAGPISRIWISMSHRRSGHETVARKQRTCADMPAHFREGNAPVQVDGMACKPALGRASQATSACKPARESARLHMPHGRLQSHVLACSRFVSTYAACAGLHKRSPCVHGGVLTWKTACWLAGRFACMLETCTGWQR